MELKDQEAMSMDDGGLDSALAAPEGDFVIAEKPKSNRSALVLLGVVVIGAAVAWFMYTRGGPKSADAAMTADNQQAEQKIDQFLSAGAENRRMMEQMIRNTEKFVQQFLHDVSSTQIPLSDLPSNPFRHLALKPVQADADQAALAEKKRREAERVTMLKAVQGLQVQSILHSDSLKACMVNGTLYKEGQKIEDFTVEKINAASVIVRNGSYRFELQMQR